VVLQWCSAVSSGPVLTSTSKSSVARFADDLTVSESGATVRAPGRLAAGTVAKGPLAVPLAVAASPDLPLAGRPGAWRF
jgi:hypothetical protein